jgi:hypothetical protein
MTAERWRDMRDEMLEAEAKMQGRLDKAYGKVVIPEMRMLRPATSADIVCGQVIYYPERANPYWQIVEDVLHPNDPFKAYVADDGCRYGLDGAFVRK